MFISIGKNQSTKQVNRGGALEKLFTGKNNILTVNIFYDQQKQLFV